LNISNTNGQKGNLKAIFTKVLYADNPKLEAYESYKKYYTSNFGSIISQEFYGLIKIKHICKNCEKYKLKNNYSFNVLPYIPFDVKILSKMTHDKKDLNLYDAFNCLNYNIMEVNENKYIQCKKCKELSDYKELKQLYNLSKNLVIIFDRGENYIHKTFVDFPEDLYLDGSFVENFKNKTVKYYLMSIICMIEEEGNETKRSKKKFVVFKKMENNNNYYYIPSLISQSEDKIYNYNLNQIKSIGTVLLLLYYSDYGINNFKDDLNSNKKNMNNINKDINFNKNNNINNNYNNK